MAKNVYGIIVYQSSQLRPCIGKKDLRCIMFVHGCTDEFWERTLKYRGGNSKINVGITPL